MRAVHLTLTKNNEIIRIYPDKIEYLLPLQGKRCGVVFPNDTVEVNEDIHTVENIIAETFWRDAEDLARINREER